MVLQERSSLLGKLMNQTQGQDAAKIPGLSVVVFRTLEEIESVRWFWTSSCGHRDSDMEVMISAQRNNEDVLRPHVLGLYRGETLHALLIGRIVKRRLPFQLGYLHLSSPLVTIMDFPYGALRGDGSPENCEFLIREVMNSLATGEADVALLEHVCVDSALFQCAKGASKFFFRDHFSPIRPHRKRELPNTIEEYRARLSSSERKRFRQIAKKLSNDYPRLVDLVRWSNFADFDRAFKDVSEVAEKTWQHKLGLGGFNSGDGLRAKMLTEAKMGALLIYVLYLAGRPSAFWIGSAYQKTFYSDYMGYDPEFARLSLGTHMLAEVFEDLCLNGIRAVDFGFSDEDYKRRFGNVMWNETSLHLFPTSLNGLKFSIMRGSTALIGNSMRALLAHTGLLQKVKRVWRRMGSKPTRAIASSVANRASGEDTVSD